MNNWGIDLTPVILSSFPIQAISKFLSAFFDNEEYIYFRFFDDRDKNGYSGRLEVKLENLSNKYLTLKKENEMYKGISFVVNGGGHKDDEVINSKSCKAQFMEIDDFPINVQLAVINALPIKPSIINKTQKSLHTFWLLKDGDITRFRDIQNRIREVFRSDPSIINESRVMRVPGFYHNKLKDKDGNPIPIMVDTIHFQPDLKYTQDEILKAFESLTFEKLLEDAIPNKDERVKIMDDYKKKKEEEAKKNKSKKVGHKSKNKSFNGRHNELVSLIGMETRLGRNAEDIKQAVRLQNESYSEPLTEDELTKSVFPAIYRFADEDAIKWDVEKLGIQPQEWRPPKQDFINTKDGIKIKQNINNIVETIQYDPSLFKKIRYNELSYAAYVFGELPWNKSNDIRDWTNNDDANLRNYLEIEYGLKSTERNYGDAFSIVIGRNTYNPVKELLDHCYQNWDKKEHIVNLLHDYLGVEPSDYSKEVMKLFMVGSVTRIFNPGCKFDYVPIIYGKQGCGKSTFCRMLAMSDEWFDDNFNTIEGEKAAERLSGLWIAELAELLAAKKAKEQEAIKAFISSRTDIYRPKYERRTERRSRVCTFIGTTNNSSFLVDKTGNRRFLPLIANSDNAITPIIDPKNITKANEDIKQAWGEAVYYFYAANREPILMLPPYVRESVDKMQDHFLEEDPNVGIIQEYLNNKKGNRVCVRELWDEALKSKRDPIPREMNNLREIMLTKIEGWEAVQSKRSCGKYGSQRCFERILETKDEIDKLIDPPPF